MGRSARWKPKRLGEKLLQIRNALGLSQNEMIKCLDLEGMLYRTNISSYEVEDREPPLPVLLRYARAAGVSMEVLVDDALKLPKTLPGVSGKTQRLAPRHRGASLRKR